MLKVCKNYKHINKDPVDKVAQFRGANSQNYWQKTTLQKFLLFCFTLALLGCEIPFKLHTANCNDLVTAQFLIYYAFQPLQKSTFLLLERKTEKKQPSGHTYIFVTAMLAMLAFGSLFFHVDVSHLEILVVVLCTTIRSDVFANSQNPQKQEDLPQQTNIIIHHCYHPHHQHHSYRPHYYPNFTQTL